MDPKSSESRPSLREIVSGVGMAGCFLVGGLLGVVLVIAGFIALNVAVEQGVAWLTDVVGDRGIALIVGGGFLTLGVVLGVRMIRRGKTPDLRLSQWLIALTVTGGIVLLGLGLLIYGFSSGSGSPAF